MLTQEETKIVTELIATKPKVLFKIISFQYPIIFEKIQSNIGNSFSERLWLLLHNNIQPMCAECGNVSKFLTITDGYQQFCSQTCKKKSTLVLEKMKSTCIEKYGVDNIFKTTEFISNNKIQQAGNSVEARQKSANTKLERYGDPKYNNREKSNQTKLERYNDIKYCNKEKIIATNQSRYNVNSFTVTQEGKDKIKTTNHTRCGYNYNFQIPGFMDKLKSIWIKKYGVSNPGLIKGHAEAMKLKIKAALYDKLINSDRLHGVVIPLFTKEEYLGVTVNHLFKCTVCGNEFLDNLNDGNIPRCYICHPTQLNGSNEEDEIYDFIAKELNINNIIRGDRKILSGKELDLYFPDYKLAIEYNGLYWHSNSIKKDSSYHLNKTIECEKQGIHLIHIFSDEWFNKQDIIKSKLIHLFNRHTDKIYARKCIIKEISSDIKNNFLDKYHIQGGDISKYRYGLFYNDELVSVMTFGQLRNKSIEGEFELFRYASKYNVIGGGSKLLKHFINTLHPTKIISYADRRFTNIHNNIYNTIGFQKISDGVPNYWYTKDYLTKSHRFNYRKSQLEKKLKIYDPILTEWQNMQLNGYDKIYDCGSLKYELIV